jgi:diaminohydroxyphosphoribosylaminopyrimidine deaminase/5-amino-6-(5-phosphoribosylamino)uracil reductase
MKPLEEALDLAARGVGRVSPNPAVGAVVVKDGVVVGRGFHTWAGVKHAEILALEEAAERARGATLYVTLEPCSHQGRTPPCADALIAAGISKVVAAMQDPNPEVSGRGFAKLIQAGIEVEIEKSHTARAVALNPAFAHFMKTGRPLVTVKAALTLDGKIAAPDDGVPGFTPGWITSEEARAHVQTLRHRSDAILTGIGTVLADDCQLTDRTGEERSRPLLRIVLDSLLRLSPDSRMVTSARGDVLVVTTSAASSERRRRLEDKGVRIEVLEASDGRVDLGAVTALLGREKYLSLMIEAGSRVNWTALESGVADKIYFYYAPKILGGTHSIPVAGGTGRRRRADAIPFERVELHQITSSEFAVEAWLQKEVLHKERWSTEGRSEKNVHGDY